jgi:MFS family permease
VESSSPVRPSCCPPFRATDPAFHAVILIPSAITGIFAGSVSNTLSRKRTIALGCFIFAVGQAVSAVTFRYIGVLILGRIIAGSGEGLFLGTLSTYVSEIVRRFSLLFHSFFSVFFFCVLILTTFLLTVPQTHSWYHARHYSVRYLSRCLERVLRLVRVSDFATVEVRPFLLPFFDSRSHNYSHSISWRLPFIVNAAIAAAVGVGALFIPYSPRWLLLHNRREEAEAVLKKLCGETPAGLRERRELLSSGDQAQAEKSGEKSKRGAFMRIWQKDVRWRTTLGLIVNVGQMLAGIDFVVRLFLLRLLLPCASPIF